MWRNTKIVATLGPSSSDPETIYALAAAGVNVFRLNFSHGTHSEHQDRYLAIRKAESRLGQPLGVMADLQGPKIRIGTFSDSRAVLRTGEQFILDNDQTPGTAERVYLPHPEIFEAAEPGHILMIDDGKIRLRVTQCSAESITTKVEVGGVASNRKGVNLPDTAVAVSAMTTKDRADVAFALALGADWIALSFVQRPEDVQELRDLVGTRCGIVSKLEKPQAMTRLDEIVALSDAVMVARGDLGVEMPAEDVPVLQRQIIASCRRVGRPVVVATQMLESMIGSPTPTRAEASDVATAVYAGVDGVMLSAETAAGTYPLEAVRMMDRIIRRVEEDPNQGKMIRHEAAQWDSNSVDAMGAAVRTVSDVVPLMATVTYTMHGTTALRVARERPATPIVGLTPRETTARRLGIVWGIRPIVSPDATDVEEMVDLAVSAARASGFDQPDRSIAIVAGMPFGVPGTTNLLHLARIPSATTATAV